MTNTYTAGLSSNVDSFVDPPPPPPPAGAPPGPLLFYFVCITYDGTPTFKLTQIDATKKAGRPKTGSLPVPLPFEQREIVPKSTNGPTAAAVLQAKPLAGAIVRVEVTIGGVARPLEDFDFSPSLNAGQVTLALRHDTPPRLSLALNTTYVAKPTTTGNFDAPDTAAIVEILAHIHGRLMEGLDAAWLGSDGSPELVYGRSTMTDEQRWAKAITEMMLVSPYGLPSTLYSDPLLGAKQELGDGEVLAKYFDAVDPGHSIGFECQHLVTMAAMTRGLITVKDATNKHGKAIKTVTHEFTAGKGSLGIPPKIGGRTSSATAIEPLFKKEDLTPPQITPGSSWVYDGAGGGNTGSAHIGFAVRVDVDHKRVQTFDTGGLSVQGHGVPAMDNCTYDDPWCDTSIPGPGGGKFQGVCLLPEPTALGAAVDHMAKVRPLGFARLVLMSRAVITAKKKAGTPLDIKDILFATPLLRMHHGERNFRLANYLWSMREHPGAAQIVAIWMIYTPRGTLARAMIFGDPAKPGTSARGFTIRQLIDIAQLKATPTDAEFLAADKTLGAKVMAIEDQESKPDGSVIVTRRWDQHSSTRSGGDHAPVFDQLPWGTRAGSIKPTDAELADLPYFTSG